MNKIFKNFVFLFAFLSFQVQCSYLTYKNGQVDPAIYTSPSSTSTYCVNNNGRSPKIKNINFGGSFPKKPSFISYIRNFDITLGSVSFTYSASVLNEANAQISVTCPTQIEIHGLSYYWLAIYDPRITVIDSGTIAVTGVSSRTFQYTYNNTYAQKGFINLQSVGYNGAQNFVLEIQSVTSTQVDILFTSNTNYLKSIGFQVVIGPDDAFTIVDKQTPYISSTTAFTYTLADVENSFLLITGYGYQWSSNTNNAYLLRLTLSAQTATSTAIQFYVWGQSSVDKVRYKEVQFNLKNYNVYYPFICAKMRVVKKQVLSVQPLKLYIDEQSKTYLSGDSYTWQLDPGVQTLNIIASLKCPQRYKLVGYVLKCIDCIKDTYDLSTDCYGGAIDYVEHRIKLTQQDYVYQQLQIEVTDTSITITQLTLHPKSIILSLELIRK